MNPHAILPSSCAWNLVATISLVLCKCTVSPAVWSQEAALSVGPLSHRSSISSHGCITLSPNSSIERLCWHGVRNFTSR
ncbi:hypothetical protein PYCCODRAFT_842714 [Trametes coccinea BRFM310]|uniref:Secreted protein n=1 Tax=Trametes coccinea (strain BRFM310) TaxID=1353009 RepID=A0A1Y2IE86_TRAC3|nr:hypothetical protein PYCCODRAFT_842714 [Trametes coccinea BRFM310]